MKFGSSRHSMTANVRWLCCRAGFWKRIYQFNTEFTWKRKLHLNHENPPAAKPLLAAVFFNVEIKFGKRNQIVLSHAYGSFIVESENVGMEYAPILKPMSKFSEEEQERCALECSAPTNGEPHPQITVYARRVDWLCRNHYDIFGLISAGLAVDYYSF